MTAALRERVTAADRALQRQVGSAQALALRGREAHQKAEDAKALAEAAEEASRLLAQFADLRQAKVVQAIETVVSAGLTAVFGEPMRLVLEQVVRARRVEVDVRISSGDGLTTSVMDARGGGLVAVVAFLLRVTTLALTRGARRLIVSDESFAHLSAEYTAGMAEFLAELCEKLDLQILLITHQSEFAEAADTVIQLTTRGDAAVAEVLR